MASNPLSEAMINRIICFLKEQILDSDKAMWTDECDAAACDLLNEILSEATGKEV